ncbi:MAG TPA: Na+/H+ antiporter subunit C [Alphaproteobacteria bacterium]|nr:Na+/H+ antiporter subunit C [Alphaproteobacteria bacterium]
MDYAMAALVGIFFTTAVYLLVSRSLIRMLLGLALLGNAVNLLILVAGRLVRIVPPIAPPGAPSPLDGSANPLPQALILTAIVIGFGMFSFLLVLAYRAYEALDADDTGQMRVAEPPGEPRPPLSY